MSADFYRELARKAEELLGDGEWHSHEQVTRALMRLVPPGPARRRSEQDRLAAVRKRADGQPVDTPRKRPRSEEDQIYSGQRGIVRDFLSNRGVFEVDRKGVPNGSNADRQIRMVGRHKLLREGTAVDQRARLEQEVRDLRRALNFERDKVKNQDRLISELHDYLVAHGHRADAKKIIEAYEDSGLADAASSDGGKRGRR